VYEHEHELTSDEIITELFTIAQGAIATLSEEELKEFFEEVNILCKKMSDVLVQSDDDIGKEVTYGHGAASIIALMRRFVVSALDDMFQEFMRKNF